MSKVYVPFVGLLLATSAAMAQRYETRQHLTATVVDGATAEFKAVEHLTAANRIGANANVHFVAGQSVTLQPGFVAPNGTTFSAEIQAVSSEIASQEGDRTLKVVVYPNPFTDVVSIGYTLPEATIVKQTLTDARGQILREAGGQERESAGAHTLEVKGDAMPTGVYFLQLQTSTEQRVIRLIKK